MKTHVFPDDGRFPNSHLPVLIYEGVADFDGRALAAHDWSNSWRNGVYSYHHYHSTSHEVLVVAKGRAELILGGPVHGHTFAVEKGDVIVIPAGVAHKKHTASDDFEVIGAYPGGRDWDILKGEEGERPRADENIAKVPLPAEDPVYGKGGPLRDIWQA